MSAKPSAESILPGATPQYTNEFAALAPGIEPEPLYAMLDRAARFAPRRVAMAFHRSKITYAQLQTQAERIAASLRAHGLERGDRVAIIMPNLPQTVLAFWGVLKAGGVVTLTNPLYMEAELSHQIRDSGAKFVIAFDLIWPKLAPLLGQLPVQKCFITRLSDALSFPYNKLHDYKLKRQKGLLPVPFDGKTVLPWKALIASRKRYVCPIDQPQSDLAVLQYTGGTTGVSKGVMLTHWNLSINTRQLSIILQATEKENHAIMAVLPLFHVYGLVTCLLLSAWLAGLLIPVPRYAPQDVLELIKKYKPTIFPGAPSLYISLLQQKNIADYDLRSIRYCISGSAPMPVDKFAQFAELTGGRIIEGYGLTEASPVTHLNPLDDTARRGSIGLPIPWTEAKVVDMEVGSVPVPPGVPGELVLRGPQVMLGYWNHPDETAGALRNGWLYTGDIARMDEDGFYYILDRKKDMYIVNGFNVYPREIDEVLAEHPKIFEAVAVGVPHGTRGETIKVFVVPKPDVTLTKEEVIAHCRKKLAQYKVPRTVEFRAELPKSAVGKILRRLLLAEELQRKQAKGDVSAGTTRASAKEAADGVMHSTGRHVSGQRMPDSGSGTEPS